MPPGTRLAPKPAGIKDWNTLSADERRLFARQAETFAAYADDTDHHIGRLLQAFADVGQADNTLVFHIAGDNGTSGEGGQNGMFNEYTYFNGVPEKVPDMLQHLDQWGSPQTYPHMAAGWAVALDAPFGWMKQVPSGFGGTRNGMAVQWPRRIKAKERHTTQYFEIAGNRAIYHDGWFARTIHRAPWEMSPSCRSPLSPRPGSITCCRSTTVSWSAWTPRPSAGPT